MRRVCGWHSIFYSSYREVPLAELGETLATVGNSQRQLQACNNCHGPGGAGEPAPIPYLAGQYSNYIAFTLREWQRGFRKSSPNQMAVVAKNLTGGASSRSSMTEVGSYCSSAWTMRP